jgi:hypothetical protein
MEGEALPQCQAIQGKNQKVARQANQDQEFKPGDKVLLFNSHVHLFGHG